MDLLHLDWGTDVHTSAAVKLHAPRRGPLGPGGLVEELLVLPTDPLDLDWATAPRTSALKLHAAGPADRCAWPTRLGCSPRPADLDPPAGEAALAAAERLAGFDTWLGPKCRSLAGSAPRDSADKRAARRSAASPRASRRPASASTRPGGRRARRGTAAGTSVARDRCRWPWPVGQAGQPSWGWPAWVVGSGPDRRPCRRPSDSSDPLDLHRHLPEPMARARAQAREPSSDLDPVHTVAHPETCPWPPDSLGLARPAEVLPWALALLDKDPHADLLPSAIHYLEGSGRPHALILSSPMGARPSGHTPPPS
jgi:hypothetical protein